MWSKITEAVKTHVILEEVSKNISILALPEEIARHEVEGTHIFSTQTTGSDQQGDGHWDRQIHGERKTEPLYANLACKFSWKIENETSNEIQ